MLYLLKAIHFRSRVCSTPTSECLRDSWALQLLFEQRVVFLGLKSGNVKVDSWGHIFPPFGMSNRLPDEMISLELVTKHLKMRRGHVENTLRFLSISFHQLLTAGDFSGTEKEPKWWDMKGWRGIFIAWIASPETTNFRVFVVQFDDYAIFQTDGKQNCQLYRYRLQFLHDMNPWINMPCLYARATWLIWEGFYSQT